MRQQDPPTRFSYICPNSLPASLDLFVRREEGFPQSRKSIEIGWNKKEKEPYMTKEYSKNTKTPRD